MAEAVLEVVAAEGRSSSALLRLDLAGEVVVEVDTALTVACSEAVSAGWSWAVETAGALVLARSVVGVFAWAAEVDLRELLRIGGRA